MSCFLLCALESKRTWGWLAGWLCMYVCSLVGFPVLRRIGLGGWVGVEGCVWEWCWFWGVFWVCLGGGRERGRGGGFLGRWGGFFWGDGLNLLVVCFGCVVWLGLGCVNDVVG